jgi:hypothetical protein
VRRLRGDGDGDYSHEATLEAEAAHRGELPEQRAARAERAERLARHAERQARLFQAYESGRLHEDPVRFLGPPTAGQVNAIVSGRCRTCGSFVVSWARRDLPWAMPAGQEPRIFFHCGPDCPGLVDDY